MAATAVPPCFLSLFGPDPVTSQHRHDQEASRRLRVRGYARVIQRQGVAAGASRSGAEVPLGVSCDE